MIYVQYIKNHTWKYVQRMWICIVNYHINVVFVLTHEWEDIKQFFLFWFNEKWFYCHTVWSFLYLYLEFHIWALYLLPSLSSMFSHVHQLTFKLITCSTVITIVKVKRAQLCVKHLQSLLCKTLSHMCLVCTTKIE